MILLFERMPPLLFKDLFVYLFICIKSDRVADIEIERDSLLKYPKPEPWANLQPETRYPGAWTITLHFLRHISRDLDKKQSSWDLNWHLHGMPVLLVQVSYLMPIWKVQKSLSLCGSEILLNKTSLWLYKSVISNSKYQLIYTYKASCNFYDFLRDQGHLPWKTGSNF